MATYCELDLTEDEKKKKWYYAIIIPYEINHDFFIKAQILISEWKIFWIPKDDLFIFPDYWRWIKFSWWEIDILLDKINKFEKYIDFILNIIAIPDNIWHHDNNLKIGYESIKKYNPKMKYWEDSLPYTTFIKTWEWYYLNCEKRDILYILDLIRKISIRAKEMNKSLIFVWE